MESPDGLVGATENCPVCGAANVVSMTAPAAPPPPPAMPSPPPVAAAAGPRQFAPTPPKRKSHAALIIVLVLVGAMVLLGLPLLGLLIVFRQKIGQATQQQWQQIKEDSAEPVPALAVPQPTAWSADRIAQAIRQAPLPDVSFADMPKVIQDYQTRYAQAIRLEQRGRYDEAGSIFRDLLRAEGAGSELRKHLNDHIFYCIFKATGAEDEPDKP